MDPKLIRNFCIIAHIDHGKTTLTDRILEITSPVYKRALTNQDRLTDVLEIEQERGITIKLQPATLKWKDYILNLIDTPGHIDFSYEVSRSLKACEGAILLIDATQGIQAQTLSNLLLAFDANLEVIPVLNKIDIAETLIEERLEEIESILGFKKEAVILTSGKSGVGVELLLNEVVKKVPPPKIGTDNNILKSLIFDTFYDEHKGVVAAIRVFSGAITKDDKLNLLNTDQSFTPKEVGIFTPEQFPTKSLSTGMVGYIATGIKDVKLVSIGDTLTTSQKTESIEGYQRPIPKVFASLYPEDKEDYLNFKDSLAKLALNDAALTVQEDYSPLLGQGYRVGYLGMLHLEITKERLEKEFHVSTVVTVPSVEYRVKLKTGTTISVKAAHEFPNISEIDEIEEPFIVAEILTPADHVTSIFESIIDYRGVIMNTRDIFTSKHTNMNYVVLEVEMPYAELLKGFFNTLKSVSHGFASLNYNEINYKATKLVKVDVYVHHELIPNLSFLEIPEKARERAAKILLTLKENLDPHIFSIALQAAIGGKFIAREDVKAYKKDVTAKLYGGDITRKMKLRVNQKLKKKEMQNSSRVNIPPEAYIKVIKG